METVSASDLRPLPPDWLAPACARVWEEIVNSLPASYFRPADYPMLAAYCTSTAFYREAAEIVAREGMILTSERGMKYANPANAMMLAHASAMSQLGTKLRLTPQARIAKGEKAPKGQEGRRPWDSRAVA
jgi:P27 family predicted phage terminase small subunit